MCPCQLNLICTAGNKAVLFAARDVWSWQKVRACHTLERRDLLPFIFPPWSWPKKKEKLQHVNIFTNLTGRNTVMCELLRTLYTKRNYLFLVGSPCPIFFFLFPLSFTIDDAKFVTIPKAKNHNAFEPLKHEHITTSQGVNLALPSNVALPGFPHSLLSKYPQFLLNSVFLNINQMRSVF